MTTLSRALRTSDTKLALQKLNGLTINKILDAREVWHDVARELHSKLKWHAELTSGEEIVVAGKKITKKDLKEITKAVQGDIDKLQVKLSKTVYLPMLCELRRQNEDELIDLITLLIIDVVKFYHTTEKMSEAQIFETAFLVINTFPGLTLEDVALAVHKAKSGEYGTIYNRVDGQVILNWLHKYQDRMQATGMERELQRHVQGKGSTWKNDSGYRISAIQEQKDVPTTPVKPIGDIL